LIEKNPKNEQPFMNKNAMTLYGLALLDFYNGNRDSFVTLHRDDDEKFDLPISIFFNDEHNFSVIEMKALELCVGNVLDVGAGTGRHSLFLQHNGVNTCSIDISPEAIEIMQKRGMKNVTCESFFDFNNGKFDTILLLLHGIGMVENLDGFRRFLIHAEQLLNPGGIIVFDALDVRCTKDPKNLEYHERNRKLNRYIGEIHMQFEYKGVVGEPYSWLHIDPDTLENEISKTGWTLEIAHCEPTGDYLVKLFKK
jgi:SAM-dependent methyltransferase